LSQWHGCCALGNSHKAQRFTQALAGRRLTARKIEITSSETAPDSVRPDLHNSCPQRLPARLLEVLQPSIDRAGTTVELLIDDNAGQVSIGEKRYPVQPNNQICVLSVMGRPVYERFGYAYHPKFESVYCDNFYNWVIQREGRLKQLKRINLFVPGWGVENYDDLPKRTESKETAARDRATFELLKTQEAGETISPLPQARR
jgi:hypothetical protein